MLHTPLRLRLGALLLALAAASCGGPEEELGCESYAITAKVEQWRKLVEKYFKYQHVTWGLNIIQCESGGDPKAYNSSSGASGLFQHLAKYWPARATAAGFPGASPFNAEANIAASAYLLYAAGGGPQHWSCKYSPYEDFNYQPQYYKNGTPVACTPSCSGTKMTSKDCSVGDCAAYGATCVNDSLGVRCVSVFCPAQGQKKVCVDDKTIGECDNGGISTGDCAAYGAFCSTAGGTEARCVSVFCAAGPKEVTTSHDVCLPDGRLAHCTAKGGLENAAPCPSGASCVSTTTSASCVAPGADAGVPAADSGSTLPDPDPSTPSPDAGPGYAGDGALPPPLARGESETLYGSCRMSAGARPGALPGLLLLLLPLALARRRRA